ncbi:glycosyltransferase family 2 protein [Niallia sp. 01092]|uniref:glycosyltransferase family 2 protein n=1 Tax=Niallia sp. 01092 TaxID=3457759 RepID=UPI003FD5E5B8
MSNTYNKLDFEKQHKIQYNSDGYFIANKKPSLFDVLKKKKDKVVTVVTPVYNAEKYLTKTIDSVVNQTLNFNEIEYILVDDGSTDQSRPILLDYAKKYANMVVVFLEKNTGTPAQPRNLGIELATAPYITFLDADDWLEQDGLETLYQILKESNDDYVVGKTIQVETKSTKIVGEHESCMERRGVLPTSIPHIFQHLGPRSRMMKTSVLKENNIRYPEMKFAEDKQFFIDVLTNAKTISTTTKPIYYLNRLDENDASLTKQTSIIQKMDTNIKVINYVKSKKLDIKTEKMILNRLYEFDCITRLFNRQHFFKSKNKEAYYEKFNEVIETTKDLPYSIEDQFFHPINKVVYHMFLNGDQEKIAPLFMWDKKEKVKEIEIIDDLPYMVTPFEENKHIRVSMAGFYHEGTFQEDKYTLSFSVYGDYIHEVNDIVLRDRNDPANQYSFNVMKKDDYLFELTIPMSVLKGFKKAGYAIFLRYNDYQKISLIRKEPNQIMYEKRLYQFYTTVNSNLGFNIK